MHRTGIVACTKMHEHVDDTCLIELPRCKGRLIQETMDQNRPIEHIQANPSIHLIIMQPSDLEPHPGKAWP